MAKKTQRHDWPEAKKLCRLNQNDIEMAKKLGFGPDSLIRARPDPKQKWKLPVKYWIHELHFKRFGFVIGEDPSPAPGPPDKIEYDEEAARIYGEQLYWEDYHERNKEDRAAKKPGYQRPAPPAPSPADWKPILNPDDRDVPF